MTTTQHGYDYDDEYNGNTATHTYKCIERINKFWRAKVAHKDVSHNIVMSSRYGVPAGVFKHPAILRARREGKKWISVTPM